MRKGSIEVTPDIKDKIRETYSAGNQKLASQTGPDLGDSGYFDFI